MKYFIWILGCQMNTSDAERLAGALEAAGATETTDEKEADVIITFACSVRQTAIDRIHGKVRDWKKDRKKRKYILAGCVLKEDRKKLESYFDLIVDSQDVKGLLTFLKIDHGSLDSFFKLQPHYKSSFSAYVPIMTGCDNYCSYCAVPYTRGREVSRPMEEIVREVQGLVKNGYKEITLLGQNVNSYGKKNDQFLALIKKIDQIEGEFRVYFYSNHPKDMSKDLVQTLPNLKHFPAYIHLPLQSGSTRILQKMNRKYSKEAYTKLLEDIRKVAPEASITTDIIVGFPGETDEDFQATIEIVKIANYSMIFGAKFSPRAGTAAAKMIDDVPLPEKERRHREINDLQTEILAKQNAKLEGITLTILIDAHKNSRFFGRTDSYKAVEVIDADEKDIGKFKKVKILEASAFLLKGKII